MFQLARWTVARFGRTSTLTALEASHTIHRGSETNLLELTCRGPVIEGSINGERVASVTDYTFQAGQLWIGLGLASDPISGGRRISPGTLIEGHFSNLVVTQQ